MANYKILIKPSAVKELKSIPQKTLQKITDRIQNLSEDPRPTKCEKLAAQEKYRVRQGNYRIIYSIDDTEKTVLVVKVGHRKDVYR